MAGFALLVYHSIAMRGLRDTLLFMLPILFFGWLKEAGSAVAPASHEYVYAPGIGPGLLGVPLIIPVGWTFAFYLGRCVAEKFIAAWPRFSGNVFALMSALIITVFCISFCVEVTGASAGWWVWQRWNIHNERWIFDTPKFVLIGWMTFSLFFTLPFFLMQKTYFRKKRVRRYFPLLYIFPAAGKIILGPAFNVIAVLILFLFIFVLPFKVRLRLDDPPRGTALHGSARN